MDAVYLYPAHSVAGSNFFYLQIRTHYMHKRILKQFFSFKLDLCCIPCISDKCLVRFPLPLFNLFGKLVLFLQITQVTFQINKFLNGTS